MHAVFHKMRLHKTALLLLIRLRQHRAADILGSDGMHIVRACRHTDHVDVPGKPRSTNGKHLPLHLRQSLLLRMLHQLPQTT